MIFGKTLIPWCAIPMVAPKIAITYIYDNFKRVIPSLKIELNTSCLNIGKGETSKKENGFKKNNNISNHPLSQYLSECEMDTLKKIRIIIPTM
jgi:hypothetical protein